MIDPLLKEHDFTFDFSLMFSAFSLPDLAQVNITTTFERL
jgi:hypothetical protein